MHTFYKYVIIDFPDDLRDQLYIDWDNLKIFGRIYLAKEGINIKVISTSEIKVSILIDEEYTELALKALHSAYGLDRDTDRIGSP